MKKYICVLLILCVSACFLGATKAIAYDGSNYILSKYDWTIETTSKGFRIYEGSNYILSKNDWTIEGSIPIIAVIGFMCANHFMSIKNSR